MDNTEHIIQELKSEKWEMAQEIERLREEKDRYKEVLLQIVRDSKEESDISDFILYLAEKALQQKESE